MKKPSKILCGIIAAVFAVSLSGCLDNRKTVVLTVWGSSQNQKLLEEAAEAFSEHYASEAKFEITVCEESESTCRATVLFCPEAAADVFFFADDQLKSLCEANVLLEVTENTQEIIDACGGSGSVGEAAASYNNTLYAYPLTASNGYFMYYNKNYFSEEDVRSLDRILEICKQNGKKFAMELTSGWYLYSFYEGAGLDVRSNEDGTGNYCDWNRTDTQYTGVQVTEAILDMATSDGFINASNDTFVSGIKDGTIIAGINGTWNSSVVMESFGDGYEACMLPCFTVNGEQVQMHSVAGYKLAGVNAYTKETYWAQMLAQWLTNEENQLKFFEANGEGPANINAAKADIVQQSVAISALAEQTRFGHLQYVAGEYWNETFRLGNVLASGNIEGRDLQELLDEFVNNIS